MSTSLRLLVSEPGDPEPATFLLAGDDKVIGREPHADLIVEHSSVSSRHGLFRATAAGYAYTDLGSTNGSALVRGGAGTPEGLTPMSATPLAPGDVLWLGDHKAPVVVRIEAGLAVFASAAPAGRTVLARAPLADLLARADVSLPAIAARALAAETPAELAQTTLSFLEAAAPRVPERGVALWGPGLACERGHAVPKNVKVEQVEVSEDGTLLVPLVAGGVSWGLAFARSSIGAVAFGSELLKQCAVVGPLVALAAAQLSSKVDLRSKSAALAAENDRLSKDEADPVGASPAFTAAVSLARQIAQSDVTLCILGETGTGKEVLARAVHRWSARAKRPFVAFNCAAVPESLIESELFGHVRGAFTGALGDRVGLFEEAHGGTLFLDEIGEMPLPMQAKLLRVLQEGEVRKVGASKASKVDVRIVSATHRELPVLVSEGRFRADLMYRINAVSVRLPPLRERGDDIALLAHVLLARAQATMRRKVPGFAPDALWALSMHTWPGNVRELENEVMRALALTPEGEPIRASAFGDALRQAAPAPLAPATSGPLPLKDVVARAERAAIDDALQRAGGNVSEAARLLELTRPGLYKAMERLGMR